MYIGLTVIVYLFLFFAAYDCDSILRVFSFKQRTVILLLFFAAYDCDSIFTAREDICLSLALLPQERTGLHSRLCFHLSNMVSRRERKREKRVEDRLLIQQQVLIEKQNESEKEKGKD